MKFVKVWIAASVLLAAIFTASVFSETEFRNEYIPGLVIVYAMCFGIGLIFGYISNEGDKYDEKKLKKK